MQNDGGLRGTPDTHVSRLWWGENRPLDRDVATCFECDAQWQYDEDYSEFWAGDSA